MLCCMERKACPQDGQIRLAVVPEFITHENLAHAPLVRDLIAAIPRKSGAYAELSGAECGMR